MTSLSKTQRNTLYGVIVASPLDVFECDFSSEIGLSKIIHKRSGSELHIFPDPEDRSFRIWARIGDEPSPDREWRVGPFDNVLGYASKWGKRVSEWIDAPDLWEAIRSANAVIPGELSPDSDNTAFTPEEQTLISGQLREIVQSIKETHDLTVEQTRQIDEKFEEAEKASRRMGRKDWGLLFGGAVFSLILSDAITPGIAGHILMMIEHGIGHLFGGPPVGGILSVGQD